MYTKLITSILLAVPILLSSLYPSDTIEGESVKTGEAKIISVPVSSEPVTKETLDIKLKEDIPPPKQYTWRVNSLGQSKTKQELGGISFYGILQAHGLAHTIKTWQELEDKYQIVKELPLCIAWADSGLGRMLKTKNNIGNVGNNDRGHTRSYNTIEAGIEAIFSTLNGKYLGYKQSIGSLSPGGGGTKPFYATSRENWNINVLNCMSTIYGYPVTENFSFRIK